jgi:hypothetical protein
MSRDIASADGFVNRHSLFQIITSLVPAGAERLVVHLLEHVDRERFAPVCICLANPVGSHLEARVQQLGIPLYFLGKGDKMSLKVLSRLDALFRQYRPAVVHTHLLALNYAYPLMIRYRTPARVYTVHSLAEKDVGLRTAPYCARVGVSIPSRQSCARCDCRGSAGKHPESVRLYQPAADSQRRADRRVRARPRQTRPVATGARHRNARDRAGACRTLRPAEKPRAAGRGVRAGARDAPLYLLLVGGGELENAVREQVAQLGLEERVRFLGVRADVADILRASDVFVLSSRWEGNPMSVMEAMAAGLPVVSTAVGGVPELVREGETGRLVPSEDAGALAQAMQALVDDPARRQAMGAAARQHAIAHFDIRHTVRGYEQLYEKLLTQRPNR